MYHFGSFGVQILTGKEGLRQQVELHVNGCEKSTFIWWWRMHIISARFCNVVKQVELLYSPADAVNCASTRSLAWCQENTWWSSFPKRKTLVVLSNLHWKSWKADLINILVLYIHIILDRVDEPEHHRKSPHKQNEMQRNDIPPCFIHRLHFSTCKADPGSPDNPIWFSRFGHLCASKQVPKRTVC